MGVVWDVTTNCYEIQEIIKLGGGEQPGKGTRKGKGRGEAGGSHYGVRSSAICRSPGASRRSTMYVPSGQYVRCSAEEVR